MTETQTFQSTPWEAEPPGEVVDARVWGSDGDLVAVVSEHLAYEESSFSRARLIAASPTQNEALTAIHALSNGEPAPARRYAKKRRIDDPFEKDDPGANRARTLIRRISEHALAKAD